MRGVRFFVPALCVAVAGCATVPYRYGIERDGVPPPVRKLREGEPQIERGQPNTLIDGVGWIVGIPGKILLLDIRVNNHSIRPQTEEVLRAYLDKNGLTQVKVRVNQYAPLGEWHRLQANKNVGWGWRYTFGMVSWLLYTVLPGRIFGGDNYNPYTDTINLYSDVPAIALHEAGHAKDFARRKWKGLYAAAYMIPGVSLYHEAQATGDVMGYLRVDGTAQEEKEGYHVLYPAYATYLGGGLAQYVLPLPAVYYGAIAGGHVVGRVRGAGVESRRAREQVPPSTTLVGRQYSESDF